MGRILIVDDQIEVRRMLRAALETLRPGLSITDIPSGEEALLLLPRQAFDLAVFDVHLAGMSGLELLGKARQLRPDLKVILITGQDDPALRQRVANAGAEDYFFKPVEIPDFINAVDYCIGRSQRPDVSDRPDATLVEREREVSIPSLLTILGEQIDAICVLLVDQNGEVLARSGRLPGDLAEQLLVSLGAGAAHISVELSHLLGLDVPQDPLCFSGRNVDLVIFHSGRAALLAVVNAIHGKRSRAGRFMQVQPLLGEISSLLASASETPEIDSASVPEAENTLGLEQLLGLANLEENKSGEIQAFWEHDRARTGQEDQPGDSRLSFEQARLLGLIPDEELPQEFCQKDT
jgi:CheY-like chemotaxis protein